jgi:hypothetical protein
VILNLASVFLCRVFFYFAECPKKYSTKNPLPIKSLSSVTLGKDFIECKITFDECLGHSTKTFFPVLLDAH